MRITILSCCTIVKIGGCCCEGRAIKTRIMRDIRQKSLGVAWLLARTIGYIFGTWAVMFYLDANLRPPGFTGRSVFALAILPLGSYRLAKDCGSRVFFFFFGFIGAVPVVVFFFGSDFRVLSLSDMETAWRYVAASIAFLAAVGLVCSYSAIKRWEKERYLRGFEVILKEIDESKRTG